LRIVDLLLTLAAALVLSGCGSPAAEFDRRAAELGLIRRVVHGTEFDHAIYEKGGAPMRMLHVYLDGDGTPWIAGRPADDPTPRNPLVLRLMALDPAPALYLGRPCYNRLMRSEECTTALWTSARYSDRVVASMAAALRQALSDRADDRISLFGYSGGGTLAVMLAEQIPETAAVVTVAANLDTRAWAMQTGRDHLDGSLNPATRPPLPSAIVQRHYVGGRDRVVRPEITAQAIIGWHAEMIVVGEYDHVCCWQQTWSRVLAAPESGS
jgi:pimeloyl-ACP methyl ester carboxylesterase